VKKFGKEGRKGGAVYEAGSIHFFKEIDDGEKYQS
jgi:hypothetical protein